MRRTCGARSRCECAAVELGDDPPRVGERLLLRGIENRIRPAREAIPDRGEQLGLTIELAGALAAQALCRRIDRCDRRIELAQLRRVVLDVRLARLHAGLCVCTRLRARLGLAARRARGLELVARGQGTVVGELLGLCTRGIVDEQQLAERGELLAPALSRRLRTRLGGGAARDEARPLGRAMRLARGDRRERGEGRLAPRDDLGEPGLRVADQRVERAAVAPRVLGRAAQRARLVGDQLGACVLVAGRLAQLVDDAHALVAQQRRGVALGLRAPALLRIRTHRPIELGELAIELGTCGRRVTRLAGQPEQPLELGDVLARFIFLPARPVEREPAALLKGGRITLRLEQPAVRLLVLGRRVRTLRDEPLAPLRVIGEPAIARRDLGGDSRLLREPAIELAPCRDRRHERVPREQPGRVVGRCDRAGLEPGREVARAVARAARAAATR